MLEALSMKIPVLVRDIPVYGDWLEHGAHVWKERDIRDLRPESRPFWIRPARI